MRRTGELLEQAERDGNHVEWRDLGSVSGAYDDPTKTISLHTSLTSYQELSTLAHEMSHAKWCDAKPITKADYERMERRADADAARTLITAADYAQAEAEVGPYPGALAEYLGVSLWVIQVWQREADYGRRWTCLDQPTQAARRA